jgi:hypothetical protein
MEKLVERHIMDGVLKEHLCIKTNMTTELENHQKCISQCGKMQESATKYKELSLEAFLDIGAFDKT